MPIDKDTLVYNLLASVFAVCAEVLPDLMNDVLDNIPNSEADELRDFMQLEANDPEEVEPVEPSVSWPNVRCSAPVAVAPPVAWPNVHGSLTAPAPLTMPVLSSWPNVAMPQSVAPQCVAPQVASLVAPLVADSADGVIRTTVSRDSRGRACVPSSLITAIGLRPNRYVYVAERNYGRNYGLILMRKAPKAGRITRYRVDTHGNIRISNGVLANAGLAGSSSIKFRVTDNADGIIVVAG